MHGRLFILARLISVLSWETTDTPAVLANLSALLIANNDHLFIASDVFEKNIFQRIIFLQT